jgi:hypothetical protein
MFNYVLNDCSMSKLNIIFLVIAMTGFVAVNETMVMAAQSNSTNSDKQKITVTWLEKNDTNMIGTPLISVSSEDFWKMFKPLLKQSINGSASSFE